MRGRVGFPWKAVIVGLGVGLICYFGLVSPCQRRQTPAADAPLNYGEYIENEVETFSYGIPGDRLAAVAELPAGWELSACWDILITRAYKEAHARRVGDSVVVVWLGEDDIKHVVLIPDGWTLEGLEVEP